MAIDALPEGQTAPAQPIPRGWGVRLPRLPAELVAWLDILGRLLALVAYVVAVVAVAQRHEPWFDEGQAWLLARDEPLWPLLTEQMRYEGSPALWHLLLAVPAKLGLPYPTITLVAVIVAIAGGVVIALRSPFPAPLTAGLLFSFVIGYQYAVVARSYVLLPLLLALLAITWGRRREHPWLFVLALALVANTSVHGFLVAGSVFAVHLLELLVHRDRQALRPHLAAAAVYVGVCLLVVAQLWTAPDQSVGGGFNFDPYNYVAVVPAVLNSALTGNPIVSGAAVALSLWWFRRTRTLLLWVLPTLALLTLAAVKYHNYWHDGIPFLVWIFALWASMRQRPPEAGRLITRLDPWARWAAYAGLSAVLVVQGVWWWQTVQHDWLYPYSGSRQLATWLEQQDPDTEIYAIGYATIGALPYLSYNAYDNNNDGKPPAYFHWSQTPRLVDDVWKVWLDRPDVLVWSVKSREALAQPALAGYERIAIFEGDLYWKNRAIERDAFFVFARQE